jgi:hypothetical protein
MSEIMDITYLTTTDIYKKMFQWLHEVDSGKHITDLKRLDDSYSTQDIKKLIKKDFLTTFIIICDISYEYIRSDESSNCKKNDPKKMIIKNIVGSVFGRLIFETCRIQELNKIIKEFQSEPEYSDCLLNWVNDRRNGYIWIKGTQIETLIDNIDLETLKKEKLFKTSRVIDRDIDDYSDGDPIQPKGLTRYEIAIYEFSLVTGSSYTDIESMIARGVSRAALCNILYSFIMIRQLIEGFNSGSEHNLYLAWWYDDSDLFKGQSGINYYFDGMMILDENKDTSNPWLLKCVTTSHNPLDAISSVCSILEDIKMDKCVLFLPTYPSVEAMQFSVHAFAEKDIEIIMLYLQDLYEILKVDLANDKKALIKYLNNRRIRS